MDAAAIIAELEVEGERLNAAIQALSGLRQGLAPAAQRRRTMSVPARKRTGDAMRRDWAARKKKDLAP